MTTNFTLAEQQLLQSAAQKLKDDRPTELTTGEYQVLEDVVMCGGVLLAAEGAGIPMGLTLLTAPPAAAIDAAELYCARMATALAVV
ncbi:hypothetical protein [Deinococcus multiflagellatus]|uniref:Uncharacterized protein n=1 Tax=Deinococcus multiflagellatus TaxID=1656887 RepID=A0ABW1ZNK7_9DEIO|nr:hypothetical protein [Deinococcus multiflagellatus]MBZ9714881.1 hypothetical protein [Deinococcus multiflagellatus]